MLHRTIEALLGESPDKARVWVLERLDDGRRVVSHGLHDGQKRLHERWEDGLKLFDRSTDDGRRTLDHNLRNGRKALNSGLHDGRKSLDRSLRDGRKALDGGYRDGRKRLDRGVGEGRKFLDAHLPDTGRVVSKNADGGSVLVPTLLAVAGAGAAIWWWTQYSRSKAETANRSAVDPQEGGGEVPIDHPELIMAHRDPPTDAPVQVSDKADEKLVEPAEDLMLHSPVNDTPVDAPGAAEPAPADPAPTKTTKRASVGKTAAAALSSSAMPTEALEASLGVQGAASAPKRTRKPGASEAEPTVAPKTTSKGPTIM